MTPRSPLSESCSKTSRESLHGSSWGPHLICKLFSFLFLFFFFLVMSWMGLKGKIRSYLLRRDFCTHFRSKWRTHFSKLMNVFLLPKENGRGLSSVIFLMEVKIYLSRIKVPLWCQASGKHHSANVEQYWQIYKDKLLCTCVNACVYVYAGTCVSICVGAGGYLRWGFSGALHLVYLFICVCLLFQTWFHYLELTKYLS